MSQVDLHQGNTTPSPGPTHRVKPWKFPLVPEKRLRHRPRLNWRRVLGIKSTHATEQTGRLLQSGQFRAGARLVSRSPMNTWSGAAMAVRLNVEESRGHDLRPPHTRMPARRQAILPRMQLSKMVAILGRPLPLRSSPQGKATSPSCRHQII